MVAWLKRLAAKIHFAKIEQSIAIHEQDRILEIGCESGFLLHPLSQKCEGVVGIDLNRDALRCIERIDRLAADAARLPFASNSFRTIILCHSLEHVPDVNQVLREASRVAKNGGFLIVIYPFEITRGITLIGNIHTGLEFWKEHRHQFTPRKLSRLTMNHGFVEKKSRLYWGLNPMFIAVFQKK